MTKQLFLFSEIVKRPHEQARTPLIIVSMTVGSLWVCNYCTWKIFSPRTFIYEKCVILELSILGKSFYHRNFQLG